MKKPEILWNENGWTNLQEPDAKKHVLGITCFSANGTVTEVRIRHNDGEEECLKKKLDGNHTLPMALDTFKVAYLSGEMQFK